VCTASRIRSAAPMDRSTDRTKSPVDRCLHRRAPRTAGRRRRNTGSRTPRSRRTSSSRRVPVRSPWPSCPLRPSSRRHRHRHQPARCFHRTRRRGSRVWRRVRVGAQCDTSRERRFLCTNAQEFETLASRDRPRSSRSVDIDETLARTQCDTFWLPRDARRLERSENSLSRIAAQRGLPQRGPPTR
jgi:hypothetical protein